MRICFFPSGCIPCYDGILEDRPLGGTETAMVRLALKLDELGHDVSVLTRAPASNVESIFRDITTLRHSAEFDVLVAIRGWQALFSEIKAPVRLLWTQDAPSAFSHVGIGDHRVVARIDSVLSVSSWQAEGLSTVSGFPSEKMFILRNGVHWPHFNQATITRDRCRLIYSSTPHRGLSLLPEIFTALRQRHPNLELHVFSGYDVYQGSEVVRAAYREEFKRCARALSRIKNVYMRGNVLQRELAKEFLRSYALVYPNSFPETSCITALEAQAAGCPIVTSSLGALPETVGDAGFLIAGRPGSKEYVNKFIEAVDNILSSEQLHKRFSSSGRANIERNHTWDVIARQFESFVSEIACAQYERGAYQSSYRHLA